MLRRAPSRRGLSSHASLTLSFASLAFDTGTKDGEQKEMLGNCHGTPSFKVAKRVTKSRESQGRAPSLVKGVRLNFDLRYSPKQKHEFAARMGGWNTHRKRKLRANRFKDSLRLERRDKDGSKKKGHHRGPDGGASGCLVPSWSRRWSCRRGPCAMVIMAIIIAMAGMVVIILLLRGATELHCCRQIAILTIREEIENLVRLHHHSLRVHVGGGIVEVLSLHGLDTIAVAIVMYGQHLEKSVL